MYVNIICMGLPDSSDGKKFACKMQETQIWSLAQEDPLEEGMGTLSIILAWRIPWTQKPSHL